MRLTFDIAHSEFRADCLRTKISTTIYAYPLLLENKNASQNVFYIITYSLLNC